MTIEILPLFHKGLYDQAFELLTNIKSFDSPDSEIDSKTEFYTNMCNYYYGVGNIEESLIYAKKSYEIHISNVKRRRDKARALLLFKIIDRLSQLDRYEEIEDYLDLLRETKADGRENIIIFLIDVGTAIFLYSRKRIRETTKAISILEKVLIGPPPLMEAYVTANILMVNILFDELKLYGNDETLTEIIQWVDNLHRTGIEKKSHLWSIKALMLKARLQFIYDSNIKHSLNLYEQARNLVKEHSIDGLLVQIDKEVDEIHNNLKRWQSITL